MTVTDKTKHLVWQKSGSHNRMTLDEAGAYCRLLRAGGFDDWRLPTIWELNDLYEELQGHDKDPHDPILDWREPPTYWSQTRQEEVGPLGHAGSILVKAEGPLAYTFSTDTVVVAGPHDTYYTRAVRGRVSLDYLHKWIRQLRSDDVSLKWEGLARIEQIVGPEAREAIPDVNLLLRDADEGISRQAKAVLERLKTRIAVIPITLTEDNKARNRLIDEVARLVGEKLNREPRYAVLPGKDMTEARPKSGWARAVTPAQLVGAAPGADVIVAVGPYPMLKKGQQPWLPFCIVRPSNGQTVVVSKPMGPPWDGQTEDDDPNRLVTEQPFKEEIETLLVPGTGDGTSNPLDAQTILSLEVVQGSVADPESKPSTTRMVIAVDDGGVVRNDAPSVGWKQQTSVQTASDGRLNALGNNWGIGAEHAFKKGPMRGLGTDAFVFDVEGDSDFPLTFKVTQDGYAYLCGRGTITVHGSPARRFGYDRPRESWIDGLRSQHQLVREGAAEALGWLRVREAVPQLVRMLGDSAWEVRRNACESLGIIGDASIVDSVQKLINDPSDEVRAVAGEALQRLRGEKTILGPAPVLGPLGAPSPKMAEAMKELRREERDVELYEIVERDGKREVKDGPKVKAIEYHGFAKEQTELMESAVSEEELIRTLTMLGYSVPKIDFAVSSLVLLPAEKGPQRSQAQNVHLTAAGYRDGRLDGAVVGAEFAAFPDDDGMYPFALIVIPRTYPHISTSA